MLVVAIVVAATVMSWWAISIEPTLDLSPWIVLAVVVLYSCLGTILLGGRFVASALISGAATGVGLLAGYMIWPMADGIAQSWTGIAAFVAGVVVFAVSLAAGWLSRLIKLSSQQSRRAVWIVLICAAAFGPVALSVRPGIVGRRVARNEHLAELRVSSLKEAVDRVESENAGRSCNMNAVKERYAGPPFTLDDWREMSVDSVTEDGYSIWIMIDCSQPRDYSITATPKRYISDGSRFFCGDRTSTRDCSRR